MALTYIGGGDWVPGVPARDLSDAEIAALGLDEAELAASKLYESAKKPKPAAAGGN